MIWSGTLPSQRWKYKILKSTASWAQAVIKKLLQKKKGMNRETVYNRVATSRNIERLRAYHYFNKNNYFWTESWLKHYPVPSVKNYMTIYRWGGSPNVYTIWTFSVNLLPRALHMSVSLHLYFKKKITYLKSCFYVIHISRWNILHVQSIRAPWWQRKVQFCTIFFPEIVYLWLQYK